MKQKPAILIIEDTDHIEDYCRAELEDEYRFFKAYDGYEALDYLGGNRIDLILLDQVFRRTPEERLMGEKGSKKDEWIAILNAIREAGHDTKVIMISQYITLDLSDKIEAMGIPYALEYKEMERNRAYLTSKMEDLLSVDALGDRDREEELLKKYSMLLGRSESMKGVFKIIDKIKDTRAPVLITGEIGVGKSEIAKAIHRAGLRRDNPFVTFDCPTGNDELFESTLFGHKKGAFTGALDDKEGMLHEARNGTLFMDDINNLPLQLQAKLLRTIQTGEYRPLGAREDGIAHCRIIAATNEDLDLRVKRGLFRRDLLGRLKRHELRVPPLRERREDIPLFVEHFASKLNVRATEALIKKLATKFDWRDNNIRELQNTLSGVWEVDTDGVLDVNDMGKYIQKAKAHKPALMPSSSEDIICPMDSDPWMCPLLKSKNLHEVRNTAERTVIQKVWEECGKDWKGACQTLGLPRATLYIKLKEYGIKNARKKDGDEAGGEVG